METACAQILKLMKYRCSIGASQLWIFVSCFPSLGFVMVVAPLDSSHFREVTQGAHGEGVDSVEAGPANGAGSLEA